MRVIVVTNGRQMRDFVRVPQLLFRNNPCYVPPIWLDEANAYTKKTNPILRNSDFALFPEFFNGPLMAQLNQQNTYLAGQEQKEATRKVAADRAFDVGDPTTNTHKGYKGGWK